MASAATEDTGSVAARTATDTVRAGLDSPLPIFANCPLLGYADGAAATEVAIAVQHDVRLAGRWPAGGAQPCEPCGPHVSTSDPAERRQRHRGVAHLDKERWAERRGRVAWFAQAAVRIDRLGDRARLFAQGLEGGPLAVGTGLEPAPTVRGARRRRVSSKDGARQKEDFEILTAVRTAL